MFKKIWNRLIGLIFKPAETWKKLSRRVEEHETFLSGYIYPLIGLVALAAFIGVLLTRKEFDVQVALKSSIKALLSFGGGFFLSSYLLNEVWRIIFGQAKSMKLCQCFVGYASALIFALAIILELFPEFFFLRVIVLYTVFIIWEGSAVYMKVDENQRVKFTLFASLIIMITPMVIDLTLFLLMPGLRF